MRKLFYFCSLMLAIAIGTASCESGDEDDKGPSHITLWNSIMAPYTPYAAEAIPLWLQTKSFSYPFPIKYICAGSRDGETIYLVHFGGSGTVFGEPVNGLKDAIFDARGQALDILSFKELEDYKTQWAWTCIRVEDNYDENGLESVSMSWNGEIVEAAYSPVSMSDLPLWLTSYSSPLYEVFKGTVKGQAIYKLVYLRGDGTNLDSAYFSEGGIRYDEAELSTVESSGIWTCLFEGFVGEH